MNGPKIAYGYKLDPETGIKEAIPEEIKALAQAAFYISQGVSMYKARDWLVEKTGRDITVPGLLKAIKYDKNARWTTPK